jgi:hypothetical protein
MDENGGRFYTALAFDDATIRRYTINSMTPDDDFDVVVRFDFAECLVNDELTGVFDVVGIIHDGWFNSVPVVALFVESVCFVSDASGFETACLQVVGTPRVDV